MSFHFWSIKYFDKTKRLVKLKYLLALFYSMEKVTKSEIQFMLVTNTSMPTQKPFSEKMEYFSK